MSNQKVQALRGADYYEADGLMACETCCRMVMKGDTTVLVVYAVNENPEGDGVFLFEHHCEDCGEIFRIKHNV